MADQFTSSGGINQPAHDDFRQQRFEVKNMLPAYIFAGMEYASLIQSGLPFGATVQPRYIKGFYRIFWHIYHYIKNSVEAEKLNPDLVRRCDRWFLAFRSSHRNQKLLLEGVDIFLEFLHNMQEWGIGQLFEKGIDPPFMTEDMDDFEMLLEQEEEEVITLTSNKKVGLAKVTRVV
jgi:hypothetical protein